jgi:hypothetical protein
MQILCRLLGHRRNTRRVTQWRDTWQSECVICSTRLARIRRGKWVVISSIVTMRDGLSARHANHAD